MVRGVLGRRAQLRHPLINGGQPVYWAEFVPGSPDWNFDRKAGRIDRLIVVQTPAGYRDLVCAAQLFLGGAFGVTGARRMIIDRILPHSLPASAVVANANFNTDQKFLWCSEFKAAKGEGFAGVDALEDVSNYKEHLCRVSYETPPYNILSVEEMGVEAECVGWRRYWSVTAKPEVKYLSVPRQTMYRAEPPLNLNLPLNEFNRLA